MSTSTSMPDAKTATTAKEKVLAWLSALDERERDDLARRYAAATAAGGAIVYKPDGHIVPIPPILTPEVLDPRQRAEMAADAHAMLRALSRLTAWLMSDAGAADRAALFRTFTELEHAGLRTWHHAERLATARVDFFLDEAGRARALEVNATIPAMQGYSDVIAEEFLRTVGAARGHDAAAVARLVDDNGRNTDDLLAALLEHYRALAGAHARDPLTIAIVARAGDAQLGELRHYVQRFVELGHRAHIATPDECRLVDGRLHVRDDAPDLVYRHIFGRRLDPRSDFARALLAPDVHRILNPLSSHFEVKGMLGYISFAVADTPEAGAFAETLGLTDDERAAVARSLPWTRLLRPGATTAPDGARLDDLVAEVAADPDRYVIKRSWDYGGKTVFLGPVHDEHAAARAGEAMRLDDTPAHPLDWPTLVKAAARDPRDVWVVQEFVRTPARHHLVASESGAAWHDLYVDLSVYTNLGATARPTGGASRASSSRIVNILGGGGLAPLVRDDVLARLVAR